MRNFMLVCLGCFIVALCAASLTSVPTVEGDALHTIQSAWVVVDETTAAGTEPTALGEEELKKSRVDVAAAGGDGEISTFHIPAKWNGIRFRSVGITKDSGNVVYDIYLGTLGGDKDCDLVWAGSLDFTSGDQDSSYYQIVFTLGGADGAAYVPQAGDIVTGNTSGETAVVRSYSLTSGAWADEDAAGTIQYRSSSGTFTNDETVSIKRANTVLASNALKHATSDLVLFEWADTVTATAKSWGSSWSSISPGSDEVAESELDVKGADFLVVVASTCDADAKLIIKGY